MTLDEGVIEGTPLWYAESRVTRKKFTSKL